jgi:hypothetical protein
MEAVAWMSDFFRDHLSDHFFDPEIPLILQLAGTDPDVQLVIDSLNLFQILQQK